MRDSTIKNLRSRLDWLASIVSGSPPTNGQIEYLYDMKAFCKLSVTGFFSTISYNTLRIAAESFPPTSSNVLHATTWDYLKELRKEAYEISSRSTSQEPSEKDPLRESAKLKESLIYSQLCANAYFDIIGKLERFLLTPFTDHHIDRQRISQILNENRSLFRDINSSCAPSTDSGLLILQGGKQ